MQKKYGLLIISLLLLCSCVALAQTINDDYNLSTPSSTYMTLGSGISYTGSSDIAYVFFTNNSAASGTTEILQTGIIVGDNGPSIMAGGTKSYSVALAGAGDSFGHTRNTGTMTIYPVSNITGYSLGNPVYSASKCIVNIDIKLDNPLETLSGDTTTFSSLGTATYYTIQDLNAAYNTSINKHYLPGATLSAFLPYGVQISTLHSNLGFISVASQSGHSGTADIFALSADSTIYGYTHGATNTRNTYFFENKITVDSSDLSFSVNKEADSTFVYPTANTISQFNITDGNGIVSYYPLDAVSKSGIVTAIPITITLTESRYGVVFSRTYFADTYTLSVSPSTGQLTDTYVATVSSSSGVALPNINGLSQYSLFENYGSTQYDLAKDPSGIPITYAKSGSNWTRYSGNSSLGWINIGSTLPSSDNFVLSNDSVLGTTGTRGFTAELVFSNGQQTQHLYGSITLTSSQNIPTTNTVNFTVIDASTSASIAGSNLSVLQTRSASGLISGAPWWNQTSATGKFSVSGLGTGGLQSLLFGDQIYAEGSAEGYVSNSLNLYIGSETIGSTQYIPLTLNEYAPGVGYFTVIYSAYDSTTSNAMSGVSVKQYCSGLTKVGTTNSAGIFSTYNNSVGTCSYTASKSGYTTITKSFTGTSQQILNIEIPMSASSINPTVTTTRTSTTVTGPTTVVPTTTGGTYTGFWGPYYQMFHAMGAQDTELGVLMTACLIIFLLVIIGIISGGNLYAINSAAALGFILSCAFGWIYFWLILAGVLWLLIPLVFRRVE